MRKKIVALILICSQAGLVNAQQTYDVILDNTIKASKGIESYKLDTTNKTFIGNAVQSEKIELEFVRPYKQRMIRHDAVERTITVFDEKYKYSLVPNTQNKWVREELSGIHATMPELGHLEEIIDIMKKEVPSEFEEKVIGNDKMVILTYENVSLRIPDTRPHQFR